MAGVGALAGAEIRGKGGAEIDNFGSATQLFCKLFSS